MTNVLIFTMSLIIACGGLLAIADRLLNEYRGRTSLHYLRAARAQAMTDEIEAWLRHQ